MTSIPARHPLSDTLTFLLSPECRLSAAARWLLVALVDALRLQDDGSYACDLTWAELSARSGLSARHLRDMLAQRKQTDAPPRDYEICRMYPRLLSWRRREMAFGGSRYQMPLTFTWHGDTRRSDAIANEPARVLVTSGADVAAELRAQVEPAAAPQPAPIDVPAIVAGYGVQPSDPRYAALCAWAQKFADEGQDEKTVRFIVRVNMNRPLPEPSAAPVQGPHVEF